MMIEILQPETEALIRQRMKTGEYGSVEDVLLQALLSGRDRVLQAPVKEDLEAMFAKARGYADDLEISRNPALGRPIDLS